MEKIGRNDPCPCGSGKKYKKCCLTLERQIGSLLNGEDLLGYASLWILSKKWINDEFQEIKKSYSFPSDPELNDEFTICLRNAFLFDYELKNKYKLSPFHYFVQNAQLPPRYAEVYQGFLANKLNFFRVVDIDRHEHIAMFKDTVSNDFHPVILNDGIIDSYSDDIILSRIAPFKSKYISLSSLKKSFYILWGSMLKDHFYKYPADRRYGKISGFDVLDFFQKDDDYPESLDEAKRKLKRKIEDIDLSFDFRTLSTRINSHQHVKDAFPEIVNFDFLTNRDHDETMAYLQDLWDLYPRKDLNGRSIDETYPIGPMEHALINEFSMVVEETIDPKSFSSIDSARTAFYTFQKQWLDTHIALYENKTPRQIILEERKQLNNPSKDIDLKINIEKKIDYDMNLAEKLNKDGLSLFKQGTLIGAVDCFDQITKMYPWFHNAWGNLGSSYAYLGYKDSAKYCFEKALSIEPDYDFAKQKLAFIEDKTEKQLATIGLTGAFLGGLHHRFKGRKKKDDGPINVWEEMDKKIKKLEDEEKQSE
jgi:tetratricopeptide (TPR) repeat protein